MRAVRPAARHTRPEAELDALSRQFRTAVGIDGNGLILTGTRPINQPGRTDRFLATFAGFGAAVLLVLLLACANVVSPARPGRTSVTPCGCS